MRAPTPDKTAARRLRAPLLRWYRRAKRDLPWRRTSDPYAIWVSEVMLQQTTVAAVIPYWERFLERFPGVAALARSSEERVLASWSGLGYYTRARSLRKGAIAVMKTFGGRVPRTVEELTTLPGIGRYTAGAISSLAFGAQEPVVDGNVKRVLSRLFAIAGSGAAFERACWAIAMTLVKGPAPGDWNQALMELGATVCTPRAPRCGACPVSAMCLAREIRKQESYPTRTRRPKTRNVHVAVAWIEHKGRILLVRKSPDSPLRGEWDLPAVAITRNESPGRAIVRHLSSQHGLQAAAGKVRVRSVHTILSSRLSISVVESTLRDLASRHRALRWIAPLKLDSIAVSGATTKIAKAMGAPGS